MISWQTLTPIQRNAMIAEKIMNWQWIPFDFDDVCSMRDQLWLLPDALATHNITNGEWTWYVEEEEVWPEGSISPLAHKDNRILPIWIPHYTTSMDTAWLIVQKMKESIYPPLLQGKQQRFTLFCEQLAPNHNAQDLLWNLTPEAICLAALRTVGCEIQS